MVRRRDLLGQPTGGVLLDVELMYDAPFEADRCGTCTRCLTAGAR